MRSFIRSKYCADFVSAMFLYYHYQSTLSELRLQSRRSNIYLETFGIRPLTASSCLASSICGSFRPRTTLTELHFSVYVYQISTGRRLVHASPGHLGNLGELEFESMTGDTR